MFRSNVLIAAGHQKSGQAHMNAKMQAACLSVRSSVLRDLSEGVKNLTFERFRHSNFLGNVPITSRWLVPAWVTNTITALLVADVSVSDHNIRT